MPIEHPGTESVDDNEKQHRHAEIYRLWPSKGGMRNDDVYGSMYDTIYSPSRFGNTKMWHEVKIKKPREKDWLRVCNMTTAIINFGVRMNFNGEALVATMRKNPRDKRRMYNVLQRVLFPPAMAFIHYRNRAPRLDRKEFVNVIHDLLNEKGKTPSPQFESKVVQLRNTNTDIVPVVKDGSLLSNTLSLYSFYIETKLSHQKRLKEACENEDWLMSGALNVPEAAKELPEGYDAKYDNSNTDWATVQTDFQVIKKWLNDPPAETEPEAQDLHALDAMHLFTYNPPNNNTNVSLPSLNHESDSLRQQLRNPDLKYFCWGDEFDNVDFHSACPPIRSLRLAMALIRMDYPRCFVSTGKNQWKISENIINALKEKDFHTPPKHFDDRYGGTPVHKYITFLERHFLVKPEETTEERSDDSSEETTEEATEETTEDDWTSANYPKFAQGWEGPPLSFFVDNRFPWFGKMSTQDVSDTALKMLTAKSTARQDIEEKFTEEYVKAASSDRVFKCASIIVRQLEERSEAARKIAELAPIMITRELGESAEQYAGRFARTVQEACAGGLAKEARSFPCNVHVPTPCTLFKDT